MYDYMYYVIPAIKIKAINVIMCFILKPILYSSIIIPTYIIIYIIREDIMF